MSTPAKKTTAKKAPGGRPAAKRTPAKKAMARAASAAGAAEAATPAVAALPEAKIKVILRFHLKNLSTSGEPVTDDTVLGQALSDQTVAGMSARSLFKVLTRRDIIRNGGTDKTWPVKWPDESVNTLAPKLAG